MKAYGLGCRTIHTKSLPPDGDCILLGPIDKFTQTPVSRPLVVDNRKVIRVPLLGAPFSDGFAKTLDSHMRGASIAAKFMAGAGFDIPDMEWEKLPQEEVMAKLDKLSPDTPIWIDFETTGLDPFSDEIVSIAVKPASTKKSTVMVAYGKVDKLLLWLNRCPNPLGATNAKFEQKWFLVKFNRPANLTMDTQVDYALLFEERSKGLEHMAGLVDCYGYDLEMEEFLSPMKGVRLVNIADRRQHHHALPMMLCKYNAGDVEVEHRVGIHTTSLLLKEPGDPLEARDWMIRGQTMLANMERNGLKLDKRSVMQEAASARDRIHKFETRISAIARKHGMTDFNIKSSPQKVDLLYNRLKWPIMKLTSGKWVGPDTYRDGWWLKEESGTPSTDAEALELIKLKIDDPLVDEFMDYNSEYAIYDGVLSRCLNAVTTGDGYMRSNFDLTKLVTGQISSTEPPVQNIPKTPVRRMFVSRFKGGKLVELDYSQLHLRIIGNLAQCEGFIDAYAKDIDMHSRTAASVIRRMAEKEFLKLVEKKDASADRDRDKAKRTNFSIIFEIGAKALAMKLQMPINEVKAIISRWFEEFPEIREQIERQHTFALKNGYVVSPFGRVRHLPGARSTDKWTQLRAFRQAGDYLISNSGRSITLYGMITMDETLYQQGMKSVIALQVHDSVLFDTPPEETDDVLGMAQEHFIRKITDYCADWMQPIRLVMEGFIGGNWYKKDAAKKVMMTANKMEVKDAV